MWRGDEEEGGGKKKKREKRDFGFVLSGQVTLSTQSPYWYVKRLMEMCTQAQRQEKINVYRFKKKKRFKKILKYIQITPKLHS